MCGGVWLCACGQGRVVCNCVCLVGVVVCLSVCVCVECGMWLSVLEWVCGYECGVWG